jgi:hypothetical protein
MTAYRDERSALNERLDGLRRALERRESEVTEAFWEAMPRVLRAEYDATRPRCAPEDATLDALARAVEAAGRCNDLLDRALAALPKTESVWNAHPPAPPPIQWLSAALLARGGRLFEDGDEVRALAEQLHRIARRHDPRATLSPGSERHTFEVSLSASGAPLKLGVEITGRSAQYSNQPMPAIHAVTSVSRGTARLRLRPEGWSDALFKFAHLKRECAVGDPTFDGYFFVEAEPLVARVLLHAEVRAALLTIAREDIPVLQVGGGVAALLWRFEPTEASVDAAVTVLRAMRAAPPTVPLRRA